MASLNFAFLNNILQEHHAFTNVTHPAGTGGIVVPQVVYKRASPSYPLFPTIHFYHGQQPGVSLLQVLNGQQGHVSDGDLRPITTSTSTKIKIRVIVCFAAIKMVNAANQPVFAVAWI